MEPLAIAAYVWIASAALVGAMVGAFAGAIAWAVKGDPLWVGLLSAGGYLAGSDLLASYSLKMATVFGLPLLVLTFLISWLVARSLETLAKWRLIWATLAAMGCGLIAGFSWGFLFRLDIWAPVAFAVPADVLLILFVGMELGVQKPHEK